MGCVNSKTDINDRHPNIFQVTNINDQGRPISPGKLEVTQTELVFYQRGKKPTKWPLRSLRKYGFDIEVFSFECGRRCPTGHGIYAFKCKKAEQLFNVVQQYIIGNVSEENDSGNLDNELPLNRRTNQNFHSEGYLNPVNSLNVTRSTINVVSRPGSVSSNGPLSPNTISPPSDASLEHNNNKHGGLAIEPSYTNTSIIDKGSILQHYANVIPSDQNNGVNHVYMNVTTNCAKENSKDITESQGLNQIDPENLHCYANIDSKDIEILRPLFDTQLGSMPATPTIPYKDSELPLNYISIKEVNYAELDLDSSEKSCSISQAVPPESPKIENGKGYATIDFQKTTALSQSINPRMTVEEGSRKTRHNSTINYNNSLSD